MHRDGNGIDGGFFGVCWFENSLSMRCRFPWVMLIRAEINNQPVRFLRYCCGTLLMTNNAEAAEIAEQPASNFVTQRMPIHPLEQKLK